MSDAQNFSIFQADDLVATFEVSIPGINDLNGATVYWLAFMSIAGVPQMTTPAIEKSSLDGTITIIESPLSFAVQLNADDTFGLPPGNYYHESWIITEQGLQETGSTGFMTLRESEKPLPA
jgi:hypothetical protein